MKEEKYTGKARSVLSKARKSSSDLGQNYVGTEHILLGLLQEDCAASQLLTERKVEEEKVCELIRELISPEGGVALAERSGLTPRAQGVLQEAEAQARRFHEKLTGTEHILIAILRDAECTASRLLNTMGVNIRELYAAILDSMGQTGREYREEYARSARSQGRAGTSALDQFSRDLTALAREHRLEPCVGREQEIRRLIQTLSRRTKNNPCLIGEPGVGKTAIVEGLAQRIAEDAVPDSVRGKRLLTLDLSGMVAGTKYRGEFEERIKAVMDEVKSDGSVLLFIDELHMLIGAGGAEGAMDASNILKPALSRGEMQVIGATTVEEYRKHIEKDAALERRFQPIMVEEPREEETVEILRGIRGNYENHHGVEITDAALLAAAHLSRRYISDRFLPDKAIDLMDEAAAQVRLGGVKLSPAHEEEERQSAELLAAMEAAVRAQDFEEAARLRRERAGLQEKLEKERAKAGRGRKKALVVDENDIARIVSDWTKIPLNRLEETESQRLQKLEKILHRRVIAQDEAVKAVSRAVRRGRVGLQDPNRPIGSFLFLGPTGVGKTELSKALAEVLFGREEAMIRVDMSEYMEKHSVSKLIGAPPGYVGHDDGGQLSEKVRRNPYTVILFDEIEKAHPDVFNILLQVLDDGRITDSQGRTVDFKNTVIIMTSNAGASAIVSPKRLGFGAKADEKQDYEAMKGSVMEEVRRIFKPEFLNRIDEIIVFHALNKAQMKQIAAILFRDLAKRCESQLGIRLKVRDSAKTKLVDGAYDVKYGARPLKRAIQTQVEDPLADALLSGELVRGGEAIVTVRKGKIVVTAG